MTAPAFDIPGYQLVRELGAGGMATVFLAVQTSLERRVAIKVMRRGLSDENVEKRFLLEGRTMARLPHPNIVGVYDIVQNETINYIAMEFLDGGMLSDRMRDGLTLAEAISIVVQVAGALQFAHDNGIVHRDLKPANIMFRDAHTPVLTDFGIARQQDPAATRLTQTGMMIGTPTYMSPEQATGGDIDGRSDQYSLGVLFYEMLTGRPPFEGDTPIQVVLAHLNTPPPALPPQFAAFQPIMDRLLAKDRDARYPDLRAFTRDLKTLLTASDALQHKLQIDSNQSASEQLRALGFSESQIHTGAARISGTSPIVTSQRVGPRTGSGPGVRMAPERPARPKWLLPVAALAVVAVLAIGGWWLLGRGDGLDPAVRPLVEGSLARVDKLIEQNKLVAPEGDNAFEELQRAMQAAPSYPPVQQRLAEIQKRMRERAVRMLDERKLDAADTAINEALLVAPEDPELAALQKKVQAARVAAERAQKVQALVQRAEAARRAGKRTGDDNDNALALLREALDIDPGADRAKQALASLADELLQPARAALSAGKLDEAEHLLAVQQPYLASEAAWQSLQKTLEQARERQAQQQRIAALLAEAKQRLAAGRIAEPVGDNALESLARIAELDAGNAEAAALARQAGEALAKQARAAEQAGDPQLAMARYEQALQAVPGNADWSAARQALEQKLGARQQQLARALADARTAITQRRYYLPAGNNAREALDAALKLDPNNADAKKLSAQLPALARDTAQALADEGRLEAALALLAEVTRRHPDDRAASQLVARLGAERDRRANAELRDQRLAEIQQLLARRQLNVEIAKTIAGDIAALQQADRNDAEAAKIRDTFLGGIGRAAALAKNVDEIEALAPVLAEVEQALGARSADVAQLRRDYDALAKALAAEQQKRLAALAGTLVLTAQPWATVESVVNQADGRPVALPKDASTPLRLTVQPGSYRVTFRHPELRQPIVRPVTLEAKGTARASAAFPTLDAKEYLRRAGYAP